MNDNQSGQTGLTLDYRHLTLVLVLVIVGMLVMWRPWSAKAPTRTLSASGSATIKAEPDEYVFRPSYERKGPKAGPLQDQITKLTTEIVDGLKKLGVAEQNIKLNSYGYENYFISIPEKTGDEVVVSANLEITVDNKDLAQKVQDYLLTTKPQGQITPSAQFSEAKQDELESQAREQAIADAKAEAEQTAKLLGVKVGKAVNVSEGTDFGGGIIPFAEDVAVSKRAGDQSLEVLPGQNEFTYQVQVQFAIR